MIRKMLIFLEGPETTHERRDYEWDTPVCSLRYTSESLKGGKGFSENSRQFQFGNYRDPC